MSTGVLHKATVIPKDGEESFVFNNGQTERICKDADAVGAELEEMLWPLVEKPLKAKKSFTIIVKID